MSIKNILAPKSSASLSDSIASIDREISAAGARRAILVDALDAAVLSGIGEAAAESAVLALDSELARLALRRGSFERGHAEALKREATQAQARALRAARDAASALEASALAYDVSAADTARKANAMQAAESSLSSANAALERAGGQAVGSCVADDAARDLHLPAAKWDAQPHHEPRPRVNLAALALHQKVIDVEAAGRRQLTEFAGSVNAVVRDVLGR